MLIVGLNRNPSNKWPEISETDVALLFFHRLVNLLLANCLRNPIFVSMRPTRRKYLSCETRDIWWERPNIRFKINWQSTAGKITDCIEINIISKEFRSNQEIEARNEFTKRPKINSRSTLNWLFHISISKTNS